MTTFKTFGPDAEVYGKAMLAFVESLHYDQFQSILEAHGLSQINPDKWYPQQIWLDVFSDIAANQGAMSNLVSIGMKIAETAVIPQGIPFTTLMQNFNEASYLANNRGKDIGYIEAQIIDDKHILMIDKTPYPDEFVYGAYYGMAKRFLPEHTHFVVKFDEEIMRRSQGGTETRVHIIWD